LKLDTESSQDRDEGRPESIEICLRFPDIEDLHLTVGLEGNVEGTPLGRSGTGGFQLLNRTFILLRRESGVNEVDPECNAAPALSALSTPFATVGMSP
jgi:hypothetical protein